LIIAIYRLNSSVETDIRRGGIRMSIWKI